MRLTMVSSVLAVFAAVLQLTSGGATDLGYNGHRHGSGSHHGFGGHQGYVGGASVGLHGGRYSEEGSTHVNKGNDYQKDSKYYYGGQYKGTCQGDGLYYKDDTTFVMCSNGYSHQQPCPPGTKTSGSPSYKAGYYYGYTDLCSVNLVDYGLGPEHYAPVGYSQTAAKDTTKEVQLNVRGGQGNDFFAEKEVVTSYDQRPLGHHGSVHQQHVVKEKGYSSGDGSAFLKKETEVKDATYPVAPAGGYSSGHGSGYPSGHLGSSSSASLNYHGGVGYPARDLHRAYPATAHGAHGHRSSHGAYHGHNSQALYSSEGSVGAGYPSLNTYATKTNGLYASGHGAVGVAHGTLSAVGGPSYGYPQHGAGEYSSSGRAFNTL